MPGDVRGKRQDPTRRNVRIGTEKRQVFSPLSRGKRRDLPGETSEWPPGDRMEAATGRNVRIKHGKNRFLLCKPRKPTEAAGQTIHQEKCQDFASKTKP